MHTGLRAGFNRGLRPGFHRGLRPGGGHGHRLRPAHAGRHHREGRIENFPDVGAFVIHAHLRLGRAGGESAADQQRHDGAGAGEIEKAGHPLPPNCPETGFDGGHMRAVVSERMA